jgi:hypothetical protein
MFIRQVLQDLPILCDAVAGLVAFAKSHEMNHYLCFKHILESLGIQTYVAVLVRRLLLSSTEREYQELGVINLGDFLNGCRIRGAITDQVQRQFARSFGLTQNDKGAWFVNKKDLFPECTLQSFGNSMALLRVVTILKDFSRVLNRLVLNIRSPMRIMAKVMEMLNKKATDMRYMDKTLKRQLCNNSRPERSQGKLRYANRKELLWMERDLCG